VTDLQGDSEDRYSIRQKMSYDSISALSVEWANADKNNQPFNPVAPNDYEESVQQYSKLSWGGTNNRSISVAGPYNPDLFYRESYSLDHRIDHFGHLIDGKFDYVGGKPVSGSLHASLESEPLGEQTAAYSFDYSSRNYDSQNQHFANYSSHRSNHRERTVWQSKNQIDVTVVGGKYETKTHQGLDFRGTTSNRGSESFEKIIAPVERTSVTWESKDGIFSGSRRIDQEFFDGKQIVGTQKNRISESGLMNVKNHSFVSLDKVGYSEGFVTRDSDADHSAYVSASNEFKFVDGKWVQDAYEFVNRPSTLTKFTNVRSATTYILASGSPPPGWQGPPPMIRIGQAFHYSMETGTSDFSHHLVASKEGTNDPFYSRSLVNNHRSNEYYSSATYFQNQGSGVDAWGNGTVEKEKIHEETFGMSGAHEFSSSFKFDDVTVGRSFNRGLSWGPEAWSESETKTYTIHGTRTNNFAGTATNRHIGYGEIVGKSRTSQVPEWQTSTTTTGKNEWLNADGSPVNPPPVAWGWHLLQIAVGVVEFAGGVGVTIGSFGWGSPFGILMMANGLDQAITGGYNWATGTQSMSSFGYLGYSTARWTGSSERVSRAVGQFTPLAISLGSLTGYWGGTRLSLTASTATAGVDAAQFGPFIGKSQFTMDEFVDNVLIKYQNYYDQAYSLVMANVAQGRLPNVARLIGLEVDGIARIQLRAWLKGEGISEGANSIISINRYLRNPSLYSNYRIPDIFIPSRNLIIDGSIALKHRGLSQIIDFRAFTNGGNIVIVRPTVLGGSYGIVFR
jgi:hypothetical protein